MAKLAEEMAESPLHGYSQRPPSGRWGPDFDCASFVYFIADAVGYPVGTGKDKVRFTGTMVEDFEKAGFQILPFANVGISDLQIGDVLVNLALHAEVYVGEGQVVGAQSSENGGYSGMAGDQTGGEIKKQPAYVYDKGWDFVLRPPQEDDIQGEEPEEEGDEQDMAYPYGNTTMGGGNWMPQNAGPGYSRQTMPPYANGNWMPPMQMYGNGGYPQGNLGQMNGYSQANAGGYQQPGMNGYQQSNMGGYPQGEQGGRHLVHVNDLNEVRDIHVGPGECIPVFIGEGKHMALKSANQEGLPTMRVFELHECTEDWTQGQSPMGDMGMGQQGQMVSRQEFDQLKEMIANVQSAISGSGYAQGNPGGSGMDSQNNGSNSQSGRSGNSNSSQSGGRNGRNS